MKDLLIFPCNGNAIEALDCINDDYRVIGFIDDSQDKIGNEIASIPILSRTSIDKYKDAYILAVPGSPLNYKNRIKIIEDLKVDISRFATIIHPSTRISKLSRIGYNILIMAGVVVTSNAILGNHICILPNTTIHHDVEIMDFSIICSGVSITGSVTIGKNCYIGSGTNIKNNTTIGDGAMVGIGSNVVTDLDKNKTYIGNPARPLKIKERKLK